MKTRSKTTAKRPVQNDIGDWQTACLSRVRTLIRQAEPEAIEEQKWKKPSNGMKGVPVWSCGGIICTGETYKDKVKLTFAKGASLQDPAGLFNASLDGNARRAIDLREGEALNEKAFKALVKSAVAANDPSKGKEKPGPRGSKSGRAPRLLSGGNPQIAKADGDAPVQAYIAAMPGWKREIGRKLDSVITRAVPTVRKAVKWNSPFYGMEGRGWFLAVHCFNAYVKVAFFNGASLQPLPPGESKSDSTRYLNIREDDALDEAQVARWVKQASKLPGWGKN